MKLKTLLLAIAIGAAGTVIFVTPSAASSPGKAPKAFSRSEQNASGAPKSSNPYTAPTGTMVPPKVYENVELMSIVARLADIDEYKDTLFNPSYAKAINTHFAPYKDHPAVEYLRQVRGRTWVGYNAIPAMGVWLTAGPKIKPVVPFSASIPEYRWPREEAEKFVTLLRKFYKDADCATFFASQAERYKTAEEAFVPVFEEIDVDWFDRYYGTETNGALYPLIGLGFGRNNYGSTIDFPNGYAAIFAHMGSASYDTLGKPTFHKASFLSTVIHEFNHAFVNPLNESREDLFKSASDSILSVQKDQISSTYHTWSTVVNEALVRAGEIRYMMAHGNSEEEIKGMMRYEIACGFIWMPQLVALLDEYEGDREKYPTMENFLPRLGEFYVDLATNIRKVRVGFEASKPRVVDVEPFDPGAQDVDPSTAVISVRFNEPMSFRGGGFNMVLGFSFDPDYKMHVSEDQTCLTFGVKLKPDTDCQFTMVGFRDQDGLPLASDSVTIKFRTRGE